VVTNEPTTDPLGRATISGPGTTGEDDGDEDGIGSAFVSVEAVEAVSALQLTESVL
jgi:hypothetical protein